MTTLTLGDLSVTGLTDIETLNIPMHRIFPQFDAAALEGVDWFGPEVQSNGFLHLTVRSWLLRLNGRVILVDTCVGAHKERPAWSAWHQRPGTEWSGALAAQGLTPADIDVVFCTHLHADHVGWNTVLEDGRWVPTFPNARYICSRTEFAFWEAEAQQEGGDFHGNFADSVLPIVEAGRMDLVEDGWDLAQGLSLHNSVGHTLGHMSLHAAHGPGAVFSGDAIHSPIQFVRPDWSSAFCTDPDAARVTRLALLERMADSGEVLIPAHFIDPGWGRVAADGAGYRLLGL